ncbi:helix-turn-helix domain-containing protein [Nitratireductor pacificus]|nr:helix-turn-helix transcriptional regulator [Nitratireductor pacificus]
MKVTREWPALVRSLMNEHGLSERKLAPMANVHRTTLRNFLSGNAPQMPVDHLERILSVFGYELETAIIFPEEKEGSECHMRHHASVSVAV